MAPRGDSQESWGRVQGSAGFLLLDAEVPILESTGGVRKSRSVPEQWVTPPTKQERSRSLSERMNYPSVSGIVVATLLIAIPFAGLLALVVDVVMVLRYVFDYRAPGSAQWSVHNPSARSLVVVWVVAVCTVIPYPLAFYMTWRFYAERQNRLRAGSKLCPRCAETIKAAALVCRHCGHEFEMTAGQSVASPASEPARGPASSDLVTPPEPLEMTRPYQRRVAYVIVGLAAVVSVSLVSLIFLGSQVKATTLQSGHVNCVIVGEGPLGKFEAYIPAATPAQCDAELASAREGFGPDSSSSRLYVGHEVPSGTPACVIGVAQVFTSGLTADTMKSRMCP
jgi:hypothetical protein